MEFLFCFCFTKEKVLQYGSSTLCFHIHQGYLATSMKYMGLEKNLSSKIFNFFSFIYIAVTHQKLQKKVGLWQCWSQDSLGDSTTVGQRNYFTTSVTVLYQLPVRRWFFADWKSGNFCLHFYSSTKCKCTKS